MRIQLSEEHGVHPEVVDLIYAQLNGTNNRGQFHKKCSGGTLTSSYTIIGGEENFYNKLKYRAAVWLFGKSILPLLPLYLFVR